MTAAGGQQQEGGGGGGQQQQQQRQQPGAGAPGSGAAANRPAPRLTIRAPTPSSLSVPSSGASAAGAAAAAGGGGVGGAGAGKEKSPRLTVRLPASSSAGAGAAAASAPPPGGTAAPPAPSSAAASASAAPAASAAAAAPSALSRREPPANKASRRDSGTSSVLISPGGATTGLSSLAASASSSTGGNKAGPKAERYVPSSGGGGKKASASAASSVASAQNVRLLHQRTELSLVYGGAFFGDNHDGTDGGGGGEGWGYAGETTLWILDETDGAAGVAVGASGGGAGTASASASAVGGAGGPDPKAGGPTGAASAASADAAGNAAASVPPVGGGRRTRREIALHLRGGCEVTSVEVAGCFAASAAAPAASEEASSFSAAAAAAAAAAGTDVEPMDVDGAGGNTNDGGASAVAATSAATTTAAASASASPAANRQQQPATLRPIPSSHVHLDPLSVVLRKPAASYTADEFLASSDGDPKEPTSGGGSSAKPGTTRRRRCQADSQCPRGGSGMMDALRAGSAASRLGELRIRVGWDQDDDGDGDGGGTRAAADSKECCRAPPPLSVEAAREAWSSSLLRRSGPPATKDGGGGGSNNPGRVVRRLRNRLVARCESRRAERVGLVASRMAGGSDVGAAVGGGGGQSSSSAATTERSSTAGGASAPPARGSGGVDGAAGPHVPAALRITVRFHLPSTSSSGGGGGSYSHHGGVHFAAPATPAPSLPDARPPVVLTSPHAYTTSGTHGDHDGPRSWLPTLDSASSRHRASHELTVKLTAPARKGLWTSGFGEDFGCGEAVGHCLPPPPPPPLPPAPPLSPHRRASADPAGAPPGVAVVNGDSGDDAAERIGVDRGAAAAADDERFRKRLEDVLSRSLGRRHVRFCSDFCHGGSIGSAGGVGVGGGGTGEDRPPNGGDAAAAASAVPHVIPPDSSDALLLQNQRLQRRRMRPFQQQRMVTHVWTTASWSPIPARSLAFSAGPFRALYDPEYYTPDEDDEEEEEVVKGKDGKAKGGAGGKGESGGKTDAQGGNNEGGGINVDDMALRNGEGVRQLYFCPLGERAEIHGSVPDVGGLAELFEEVAGDDDYYDAPRSRGVGTLVAAYAPYALYMRTGGSSPHHLRMPDHRPTPLSVLQTRLEIERSIVRSTSGVPNRALSLMRDVLGLPAYRSSSHTQIWIPHAVDGGSTSGALASCPEVGGCNPFLGGAILDSTVLPPPGRRLPFHAGGRALQFLQARAAVRGWVIAALPLGSADDVGMGYLHSTVESLLMGLYERGHGAWGEGGSRGSYYFSPRYAIGSGLNSPNLDFLPLPNVEPEEDVGLVGGVSVGAAAVPVEERGNEHLWRSASNGTESHTSALDEYSIRQVLNRDILDYFERQDKYVPLPSMGWLGSHLSATYLSSNSCSSSAVGCGAVELVHPIGGQVFQRLKAESLRRLVEGRAGIANFVRVIRAAFIAALLEDRGETKLTLPEDEERQRKAAARAASSAAASGSAAVSSSSSSQPPNIDLEFVRPKPPFVVCVDELIKKGGLTHMTFLRSLRIVSGPIREPYLRGSLVDVDRDVTNALRQTTRQLVEPEGFPNSFVRGASSLYLRVGVHVEPAGASGASDGVGTAASAAVKGTHLHVYAEPVIPQGGIAFGGPITLRVIENEGQCREFVRTLPGDGSRADWGPIFLHAKPVTTQKQQTAASGALESSSSAAPAAGNKPSDGGNSSEAGGGPSGGGSAANSVFTRDMLHSLGYQALELVRLTNRTPLLWIRIDPYGMYDGRISIFQPDSGLAEKLFHDGEASSQVDAIRALAERPHRIQGSVKINNVYDVPVAELPVRILGDCLRGSATLHRDLPHTPAVRVQAALAIAQWQNNKAPASRDVVGADSWVGLDLLIQYFKERYYSKGNVMPIHFTRLVCKAVKNRPTEGGSSEAAESGEYTYLDSIDKSERANAIEEAEEVQTEEDEEYRVRSAVVTAIASIRAKDGMTPPAVMRFIEAILHAGDGSAASSAISPSEEELLRKKRSRRSVEPGDDKGDEGAMDNNSGCDDAMDVPFVSASLLADSLLALCHINVRPARIDDPATRTQVQSDERHPILPLMAACHRWLEWDLYREDVRLESEAESMTGVGGGCFSSVSACAIIALCSLALLRQSTTDAPLDKPEPMKEIEASTGSTTKRKANHEHTKSEEAATAQYYVDIFDSIPLRPDVTRAAAAQAVACICCAADRLEEFSAEPVGLLTALEFLLDRIQEPNTSPSLRQTLAALMLDSCTGKVCTMQRAAVVGGRNDFCATASRFTQGPLGASHGGDNGSALLLTVSEDNYPAANAVNDGARRGLRLLHRAGRDNTFSDRTVVRVAKFATRLWRTINGETSPTFPPMNAASGVCAQDGHLRCALLALWQWIWPKTCIAVLRVQSWRSLEGTPRYIELGADEVMKITDEEKASLAEEEAACAPLKEIVSSEIDRQQWRGEMALRAYEYNKKEDTNVVVDPLASTAQDIGKPLPLVEKDNTAWKSGGWVASTAQQRRAKGADGGIAVTKIKLTMKSSTGE